MVTKEIVKEMIARMAVYSFYGLEVVDTEDNAETIYYRVTVPEDINTDETKFNGEELLKEFKKDILNMIYILCECETEEDKELIDSMIKVFGKVRKGEVWTNEDYKREYDKYMNSIVFLKEFKEV